MTMQERLNEVWALIRTDIHEADHKIDAIYEDYSRDRVRLSKDEEDFMYYLVDIISTKLYG